ncbi:alpha/beta fold hydrolase [Arthrobacter sp. B1805]|uniref:alpha/beta fold hydrolase n=1 Tax=Arthrobacter sp. B1805 TaxID=2058892 RepID=UPI000CE4BB1E
MTSRPPLQFARARDGARIAWRVSGTGDPLLLVTGQAVDSTSWDAVVPAFSDCFRVVSFDHRGTGESSMGSDDGYSTESFAADAVAVLDAAGIDRAHVYGHSMGGRVAQWVALRFLERVGALVLGATTAGDARGVPRSVGATADLGSGDQVRLASLFFRDGKPRDDAAAFFTPSASRHARRLHLAASRNHDAWDQLPRIAAPTLVLHGTNDEMTPPGNAERMAAAIPDAELALLTAARHGYYLEEPDATDRVINFLQCHPFDPKGWRAPPVQNRATTRNARWVVAQTLRQGVRQC